MSLTFTVDTAFRRLLEPGVHQFVSTNQLFESGFPEDEESHQGYWADPLTNTVMIKPLQLRDDWIDTVNQLTSIVRLDDMVADATDISSGAVKEEPTFGNPDNPWIHHNPVGPSTGFPTAPNPMPGSGPSLNGVNIGDDVSGVPLISVQPPTWYLPSTIMPPAASPPTPSAVGGINNSRVITRSALRYLPNQAFFFRWFHADRRTGYSGLYYFYVGQFLIEIKGVVVQVYEDTSANGTRTAWTKRVTYPLYSFNDVKKPRNGSYVDNSSPSDKGGIDRELLWLPFRRNQVLLYASTGKAGILQVNGRPKRLADNSDWDITRSDTVAFRVLTKVPGRFQIQTVAYPVNTATLLMPPHNLDYTPGIDPVVTIDGDYGDTHHATTLSSEIARPPSYTLPVNSTSDCPKTVTNSTDISTSYGVKIHMRASPDQRWTPFFYGYSLNANRVFANSLATPITVNDSNPAAATAITKAKLSTGVKPGEGKMTVEVVEPTPFALASKYYHSGMPVKLADSIMGTLFLGISEPNEIIPLRRDTARPRRIVFSALDPWKILDHDWLSDRRDYTGIGHIDAVRAICEQGGVECVSGEFPTPYTTNVPDGRYNQPLGGSSAEKSVAQTAKDAAPLWQPHGKESAKDFILRIANHFSGWYVGFRLDGTFFYLPKDWFMTSSVTFLPTTAGGGPNYFNPVTFRTIECEANWIQVHCGGAHDGAIQRSSTYIDHASWKNPSAVNFVGRLKKQVVILGGILSCPQLNIIARRVWDVTRRRFIHIEFTGDYVPGLKVGQIMTIDPYGDYRLLSMEVQMDRRKTLATYKGEFLEDGFGVGGSTPSL